MKIRKIKIGEYTFYVVPYEYAESQEDILLDQSLGWFRIADGEMWVFVEDHIKPEYVNAAVECEHGYVYSMVYFITKRLLINQIAKAISTVDMEVPSMQSIIDAMYNDDRKYVRDGIREAYKDMQDSISEKYHCGF